MNPETKMAPKWRNAEELLTEIVRRLEEIGGEEFTDDPLRAGIYFRDGQKAYAVYIEVEALDESDEEVD